MGIVIATAAALNETAGRFGLGAFEEVVVCGTEKGAKRKFKFDRKRKLIKNKYAYSYVCVRKCKLSPENWNDQGKFYVGADKTRSLTLTLGISERQVFFVDV